MSQRIVVTGMGAVTPIGIGVGNYWRGLISGACGIGPVTKFDASRLPSKIAAEIADFEADIPRAIERAASPFMRFAFVAGSEALSQAAPDLQDNPERAGICLGTAMAGVTEIAEKAVAYLDSATGKVSPHFVPRAIGNMAAAHLAIHYGLHGPGLTLGTACSAGGDALMAAAMLIRANMADACLAIGAESILTPAVISSLAQARALSRRNEEPCGASRPFDRERDGFVIGEGAGAMFLESESHAIKRGAKILAYLSGWGNTMDAWHITAPDPEGRGAARCMGLALQEAGLKPCDIDYINAHGTGTQLGDMAETKALKAVFGKNAPPASSTKGATGHLMGAGGLTEAIACVKAMQDGILPPTLNLEYSDPECDLDYVPLTARKADVKTAMSNSLGFGGQNSSIILMRPDRLEQANDL